MLTKNDLTLIRKIIREEVESEVQSAKEELNHNITMLKIHFASEFKEVNDKLKNLDIRTRKIQKDLDTTIDFFDKDFLKLRKRVEILEENPNLKLNLQ